MKISIKQEVIPILIVIASIAFGIYFYQVFPDQVATHWNIQGEVDDYSSKAVGAFAIPAMLVGFYLLFLVLPKIDPKKERYIEFIGVYNLIKTIILAAMFIIFLAASFSNLGYNISINTIVPIIIGLLFMFMGNFFGKIKNNWFMGIRTPWTLSSENVWNKTHRVGGYLFMLFGLGLVLTPLLPASYSFFILIGGVIALVLGTTVYSYLLYRKEKGN